MILNQKVLTYKGFVVFEKIEMSSFQRIPKLFQENEACFMFVNKGAFSVRTSDQFISFKKGKGLLAKCFDYFFEMNHKQRDENTTVEAVGVLLYPSLIKELFQFDVADSSYQVDFNMKSVEIAGLLQSFQEGINILLENPELADELLIQTKIKEFVLLMSKIQNAPSELDFLAAMFQKKDTLFVDVIAKNLYSNLSISEFAHLSGLSVSSFKRKFNAVFEVSPKKYINQKKLEKAAQLLKLKEIRISEIAYDCGFDSITSFNRLFKSHFGMSPSKYSAR